MGAGVAVRDAVSDAAQIIDSVTPSPFRAVLALTDGVSVHDQSEIVRGVYEAAGATVPLVGGCAGDDLRMHATAQMIGTTVAADAFVLAAIGTDSPMGVGVAHGWRSVGEPMFVTAVEGTTVVELDGRPALDVYLERLGADPAIGSNAEAFSAFALTHPLAHVRRRGDEVRWVSGGDIERRTLQCAVEIPRSAQVWLTEGDCQSTIDAVAVACGQALEQLGDTKPIGAIAFNCVARRAAARRAGARR